MKHLTFTAIIAAILTPFWLDAQTTVLNERLNWQSQPATLQAGNTLLQRWGFEGAVFGEAYPSLPYVQRTIPLAANSTLQVQVLRAQFEPFNWQPAPGDETQLAETLQFVTNVWHNRNDFSGVISFVPIVKTGNGYERLVSAELQVSALPSSTGAARGPNNTTLSVLSDGDIYKMAVSQSGVYKLTYDFLKNQLKISNLDNIDPRTIKVYGNGGGMLPTDVAADRPDDLVENAVFVAGENDGKFDGQDYILLYGEGPDKWRFLSNDGTFEMVKNIYDTESYYFIKIGPGNGLRVAPQSSETNTSFTSTAFNDFARLEQDKLNLLHEWKDLAQGSGQNWFGDYFRVARDYDYPGAFQFPNLITASPAVVHARMALRATKPSHFRVQLNGTELISEIAAAVYDLDDNNRNYANTAVLTGEVALSDAQVSAKVIYPQPSGVSESEGWLDFLQLNVRRQLRMHGDQMAFRDVETISQTASAYVLDNAGSQIQIWDITNPLQPKSQQTSLEGSQLRFGAPGGALREFIAFDNTKSIPAPTAIGKIDNQNLHGVAETDMIIIYHPDFESQAQRLAQHRADHNGLNVSLAPIELVYNEFSSGKLDPTAIRDFARMVYERTDRFKYLLLLGDGSFDPRNIYDLGNNFVPTFQQDSYNPLYAFPSDDYYALFSNGGNSNPLSGMMNIAVGRLPVKTPEEAENVVNKLVAYDTDPSMLRDWRNRVLFVSDDEDLNLHIDSADAIAVDIGQNFPNYNIDKLYIDAFPQESTPAGDRYSQVNQSIDRSIFKGLLVMAYLGHGGPKGWAQERILNITEIQDWNNTDRLPLFLTATCSFTGFDDPGFVSAGEETILNANGGAVGLLSTTRAVYANENALLTDAALVNLFTKENNTIPTIGEAMQHAKNSFTSPTITTNSRKFALIGDPAMVLAVPRYGVSTTKINTHDVADGIADTLRALQRVTIEGVVVDDNGQPMTNFNGVVYPTIYDKTASVTTLGQDASSRVRTFNVQRNILFKGRASVQNGAFRFTFVIPKDINYSFGHGKISYYAADESRLTDAAGAFSNIIIGGTHPDGLADDQGPLVNVFMNTEDFVFGSITNDKPVLLVKLQDDNGINVAGNSIGHDLEGVLNDDTQNSLLLNDFYEAELDDYTKGTVRYPLSKLPEGRHKISVKAWDVSNNSGEGLTEFVVASSEGIALQHVLNYPNPFTDYTCFQFDHNMYGQQLDVLIQIYTVSGRMVKTIDHTMFSDGALRRDDCIAWDGRDDFGDRLAKGVYLYKVKVRANAGTGNINGESAFEKLVILK